MKIEKNKYKMFRLNIYKNDRTFLLQLKLTEEYKEILKNIKYKSFDIRTNRWSIPMSEFENYMTNLKKIVDENMINIIEENSSSDDNCDLPKGKNDDDENRKSFKKKKFFNPITVKKTERELDVKVIQDTMIIEECYVKDILNVVKSIKGCYFDEDIFAWRISITQKKELLDKLAELNVTVNFY